MMALAMKREPYKTEKKKLAAFQCSRSKFDQLVVWVTAQPKKSMQVIAFAFLVDGRVTESACR